jgi:protein-S-isoprenylcysteine O-methyltransferase Ste14
VLLFLCAGVLSRPLEPIGLGLVAVATLMTAVRIRSEEHYLRAEYQGDSGYDAYARRTKRLIPFVF